jgi:hypothetical protein
MNFVLIFYLFDSFIIQRSQYEEENYIRLPKTKKDKVTQRNVYHRYTLLILKYYSFLIYF